MMLKIIVLVFNILGLLRSVDAQIVQDGQCNPDLNLVADFDIEQFAGRWMEVGRSDIVARGSDCSYFDFEVTEDGIQVQNVGVNANFVEERNGTATLVNETAMLTLNLSSDPPFDFWILLTNYNNFALAYNCENVTATQRRLNIWQLGRTTSSPGELMTALMNTNLMNNFGISLADLRTVEHTEDACYILPTLQPGEPVVLPGACDDDISVVTNFDAARFLGVWHEIYSYVSPNALNLCSRAEYTPGDGVIGVENSEVINQNLVSIFGNATVISTDGSARLSVTLNVGGVPVTSELRILATDYDNYAVSYTCENLPDNNRRVYSWILGRSRVLSAETQAAVDVVVQSEIVLNYQYYRLTDQSDEACFFFPDYVPDTPIVFRGLCDQSINAVANFDPESYAGIWHDIESYYSVFQTGTCRNAEYQLTSDYVQVLNTQVINQTLDSLVGQAVLASTDGSGVLNVTFPVAGANVTVRTNYWVLATDYTSYSLVYSCVNLDENERQVWTWKLSRTKQLTPQATTAINNAISTIPVLDDRYYQSVDQSEDGCFFFPEPQPGVPVVFPGTCDNSVPVVQNFNLAQFSGNWFEIEAYPEDQLQGQCINHAFGVGTGNTLDLQTSQVTDQFLVVSNGTLSFSSNDGSARMNINIVINGQPINVPFWVLATDYNDYALAYSCVQLNSDFRGIYSWKLSRTRELSTNALTSINSAIANVEVLGQEYFEPIDQSDEACFFLPDLEPGEPIILVGQCDPNITAIPNFDAGRYLGTWRLIESYPSEFQNGTCNRASYSLGANGTVEVLNSEVLEQTLINVLGSAVAAEDGSGQLFVTFPGAQTPSEILILDTDYDSYSLVYSCVNINSEQRRVWSWKLSRTNTLTATANQAINSVVNSINVLNNRYYYSIDHSAQGCFYFPEPEEGAPVLFRGQCDQNISVVQDFNVDMYLGYWHNIELYPSRFQEGTCSNAYYNLQQGSVVVLNSQVVNQTRDTITGAAVGAVDGSGRLVVTFPVVGTNETVSLSLWILDTDYVSYSLAYACENVGEYSQVWSWKLSRRKELSAAATASINSAMAAVQVLENRYFWPVDQSDAGCFYYPEPQPGQAVEFPGRCSNNIPVVQNFDLTRFQGIWHELTAYPTGEALGECTSHEYVNGTSNNNLGLLYGNVLDLSLNIVNGNLSFDPANNIGDGRLVISIPIFTSRLEIPFWVLDVDYDDYAIVYGCIDQDNIVPDIDYRIVYSWKLSRSRQLSPTAEAAIDNVISTVDVLRNEYYEDVDHTDDACFFLPEVEQGDVVVFPGQCDPNITVVQNFQAADYLGRWYLIESYPSDFQNGSCNDARYSLAADGTVDVLNTQVVGQTLDTVAGSAVAFADGTGRLYVTFPGAPEPSEYWILDTDYTSYALVYSCRNINSEQRAVWSWKLSRTQSLSPAANTAINQVISSVNVLDARYYETIDHTPEGCFYFPDPDPNTSVRFRGRCDESIPVVQNFDAGRYLGLWHLIETYPSAFQTGTCTNAEYSLGTDGVDVFNTQVINQTLDTMSGLAVVAFPDGSGRLNVSFPIAGTNETTLTPYWILATDYDTYSLVYTCVEIDEEYRQISSWKLSRTKALTPTAVSTINAVTNTIQVLDDQYYQTVDQSTTGCFYFPEPEPGIPVTFPGQCEDISVVQNFNLAAFEGIWYEIETYPKEQQQGLCVNHQFINATDSTLQLESSNVAGQALGVSYGTMFFISDDGSARLNINITTSDTTVTIPFWIVDTDYSDYALAYGCVNLNQDYRRVYSWKLSRTKTLSTAASTAINNAISSVDVIDNRYFEPMDQSDEACFFLPELAPGDPVIFPGQCDLDIPTVQNFDAARYLGRWRLIETYATEFQDGSCHEATYSLADDGTVDVYNTQVVNQLLETINGTAVVSSTDGSGQLEVNFPDSPQPATYWILATDYDSYSLVYSCRNINPEQRRVWAWKLSRDRTLSTAANNSINQVVNTINVLDDRYFESSEQSDEACFYYPTPDGGPVTFRGQCDESVAVVTNFDPVRYEGTWYDIESYPQSFQDGTCPTATYTLDGDVVRVLNTQVRAQELDVITATAVLAGNGTEAKLDVTFPIAGTDLTVTTPYWVLATDYDSYSLVYSCVNINEEYRRVTSWKLSRSQSLSAASSNAITAAINNVPILQQQYFVPKNHSEVDCFFYPDNNGGPVILDGQCEPEDLVNVVTDFDPARFDGIWHEVERFPSELQDGACVANSFDYSQGQLSYTIINNEALNTYTGPLTIAADGRGILNFVLSSNVNFAGTVYVLDVDYDDFALLYSCRNISSTSIQVYSWKLSRSRTGFSESSRERIDEIVNREDNLFFRYYDVTSQDNLACFYYPEFETLPDSIILPGPCNPTISGVPQFDAARYLGQWFEIEKYPQPWQLGECPRATYSAAGSAVDVFNTQVLNRTLLVQEGSAVVASTDGSGQLTVTFNVDGVTNVANYYILATDYDNFALVYSCRDVDNGENRQVSSWKLGRTRTLSAAASNSIDNAISATQGLLQDYYTVTDQSWEACFYIPEVNPEQPVRLRGSCDNISGQANFDLQRYLGWWHEINSYPTGNASSTCHSSQYQQVGGQDQYVDNQVFGLTGEVVSGTVIAYNNGRLTRTLPNGGQEDIWVLATDYDDYSLVYSCEPIDDEYIQVWSSMQSKSRSLSESAQQAIAAVIAGNDYLVEDLFLPVDQSDEACFHYPEQTGERVRLPGQCNVNIPVQANFDIVSYSGVWYQIERYPYPEVSSDSTCIGARYTYSESTGTVEILNWEVVNGELNAIDGVATVNNGTSSLEIVLPVPDSDDISTANLYILATDYASYSLVYTCENVNQFEREVVAFKLSRTRSLPASATNAINAYMASREELYQPLFLSVEQNDECEEPSSSVLIKSSVMVVLVCYIINMLM